MLSNHFSSSFTWHIRGSALIRGGLRRCSWGLCQFLYSVIFSKLCWLVVSRCFHFLASPRNLTLWKGLSGSAINWLGELEDNEQTCICFYMWHDESLHDLMRFKKCQQFLHAELTWFDNISYLYLSLSLSPSLSLSITEFCICLYCPYYSNFSNGYFNDNIGALSCPSNTPLLTPRKE